MTILRQNADGVAPDVTEHTISDTLKLDDQKPWPGPAAYDEASSKYFFGRSQEARELLRLIRLAPLTVVYGKSGLGKTSLLQAGLYPLLRTEHYLPVHLRVDFSGELKVPPLKQAMRRLVDELDSVKAEYPSPGSDESLWEYLHRNDLEIWSEDNFPLTPVLVFDQFEELFSRSGGNIELIKQVFDDLADLIENRIPAEIASAAAGSMRSRLELRSQRYRVVLSFREDFLPEVRTWEQKVPSLLRNCLRLEPMSHQSAIDAVERAGKAVLDKGVAPCIVNFVGKPDHTVDDTNTSEMSIEPVLLSLCCYQLNRRRSHSALIDKALVDVAGQDILDDFYQGALDDPDVKGPPDVARFIEDNLIQGDHFRGDYPMEEALSNNFITRKQLAALTDRHRMLRIVQHPDTTRVELIHDRLVPVVRKARDERKIKQDQDEQKRQAREAKAERDMARARSEELQRERDTSDRSSKIAKRRLKFAVVATIVTLIVIAWGFQERQQKIKEELRVEVAVNISRLTEGRLALGVGVEPLGQTMYEGLAAYRLSLSDKKLLLARAASLSALHRMLEKSSHLRKAVTIGDLMPTAALAYSPDGETLAVGGEDGVIRLLKAKTFDETGRLDCRQSSNESAWTLSFNSDGTRLAAGYANNNENLPGSGLVCVFDVQKRKPLHWSSAKERRDEPGDVNSVAYGGKPGAEFVISGGNDKMLRKWGINTGSMSQLSQHTEVAGVSINSDGTKVASGGDDGIIRVWDLADFGNPQAQPLVLKGHKATIQQVMFSPADPSILVSAGDDGRIMIWNVKKGCLVKQSKLQQARIYNLAVSGGFVAAASQDGNVLLFRPLETGASCSKPTGKGALSTVAAPDFDVIPDGVLSGHGGFVMGVAFNPYGDGLASTGQDGSIRIWGPKIPGFSLAQLELVSEADRVTSLAISPDSTSIAAGDDKGNIHLWARPKPEKNEPLMQPAAANWKAHEKSINTLAYIKIGNQFALVSGGEDGVLKRWDSATKKVIGPDMEDHAKPIRSIAVSPDGKLLAAGSSDGTVRLWDTATGKRIRSIDKPKVAHEEYELYAVNFSADGKYLAVGDNLVYLRVLNLEKSGSERRLLGHVSTIKSISRGGSRWLLSAGMDGSVLEWEHAALSQPQAKGLKKHDEFKFRMGFNDLKPLTSMDASADGKWIITGGNNGQVQLWDGSQHVLIGARFLGHGEDRVIRAVAMAPDGGFFVTADGGSQILVWPGPDLWADIICSKLTFNMSRAQWREWVSPEIDYVKQCPGLPILPD